MSYVSADYLIWRFVFEIVVEGQMLLKVNEVEVMSPDEINLD